MDWIVLSDGSIVGTDLAIEIDNYIKELVKTEYCINEDRF